MTPDDVCLLALAAGIAATILSLCWLLQAAGYLPDEEPEPEEEDAEC